MTGDPDDLLETASSIGDGKPLDWGVLAPAGKAGADPLLVRELQIIAHIATAHRAAALGDVDEARRIEGQRWGQLVLKDRLGAGSFGAVYRAHDPRLQRDVALKIYEAIALDDSSLNALLAEGRLLAGLRHPNVVSVLGVEQQGYEVGLSLELIDGRTLAEEVRASGPLGFREAALISQDVCRALAAVHQAGVIHRDVKAHNIMRERGGRIVLMDFGIGRRFVECAPGMEAGGTPVYMAPELFSGGSATIASDIYSVGVLLYFLVTGTYPVMAADRAALERSHGAGDRRLLRDVRPELPDAFIEVTERACSPDPATRFRTAGALQAALAGVIGIASDTPVPLRPRRDLAAAIRSSSHARAAAAALLLIAVVAAIAWNLYGRADTHASLNTHATSTAKADEAAAPPADPDRYQIRAAFHRVTDRGDAILSAGARVTPGDRLFVEVSSSRAVHVYIVNQDDHGESYLLFPLPGQKVRNPLAADQAHRLPGGTSGDALYWQVTSAGGREHFLIVASPEPLPALETAFAKLPKPEVGRMPTMAARLPDDAVGQLRGIGGLTSRPATSRPALDLLHSAVVLPAAAESVRGPWMRQLTLENPGK